MLIVATSQVKMKYTIDNTLQTLQKAGFINNVKKSHLIMTQQLPFLGRNLDSSTAKVFSPNAESTRVTEMYTVDVACRGIQTSPS